ncbi:hypothetical protein ACKWTF_014540 [Chironomus riparius]
MSKMLKLITIFLTITTISAQVSVKDGWRTVSSPWDAARFREVMTRVLPKAYTNPAIRSGRIAGGELAYLGQFPYYAFLYNVDSYGDTYVCGASIISHNWLLTAGHCLDEIVRTSVYVGMIDRINGPAIWTLDVTPANFIIHEDYFGIINDIALVRLVRAIPLSPYVTNVALPRRSDSSVVLEGKIGTVCGFGKIDDVKSQPSQFLRFINQDIVSNSVCAKLYGSVNVKSTNLCMNGTGGRSTCSGDSGGPLVTEIAVGQKTLVGVVSFGAELGCTLGYPLVFTRVTSYLDWIEANTGIVIYS